MNADTWDIRTRTLLGDDRADRLACAHVLVVGLGGVGGHAAETLCRSGVGKLTLIDADKVDISNINRQLIALHSNIGRPKAQLLAERFALINPQASITPIVEFVTADNIAALLQAGFDYVLDCIDTVAPKTALIKECLLRKIPIISSMGAGGRTDATKIVVTDIWDTRDDGLARAVRQRLKKEGIRRPLRVVASREIPADRPLVEVGGRNKLTSPGSFAPVTSTFGIFMASEALKHLTR